MPRPLTAALLALAVATCRDAMGPGGVVRARLAVAPVLPSEAALAEFGLAIDQIRIVVVRPAADTLADTTFALPPDADSLDLDIRVSLRRSPETLDVSIIASAGSIPLFVGTAPVEVSSTARPAPTEIPLGTYVGPGAGVDSIVVLPRDPFIYVGDSLRFEVEAFQGGAPVTQFYVAWSTSDPVLAPINGFGVLTAPASRSSVRVVARTPSGAADSVTATFAVLPRQLISIGGGGQSGLPGTTLPLPLEVEVRGDDNLPVGGAGVRFRALTGGLPADTTVLTGASGRAQVTAALGPVPGPQTFEASVPGFPGVNLVTFAATATTVAPTHLRFTVEPTGGVAGQVLAPIAVAATDVEGIPITTFTGNITLAIATNPAMPSSTRAQGWSTSPTGPTTPCPF